MHFELSRMIWLGCNQVSEEENTKHGGSQPYNWAAYEIGNNLNNWNWNGWRKYRKSSQTQIKESWWETSKPPQKTTPIIHVTSNLFFSFNFFTDFLHLCPGGGPAQVFAHPHVWQARPAPPLHRDLGLCHGLLNHANFSKLTPWQKNQISQELSTVGLVHRGPGLDVHVKEI